jgi:hypothetical protein
LLSCSFFVNTDPLTDGVVPEGAVSDGPAVFEGASTDAGVLLDGTAPPDTTTHDGSSGDATTAPDVLADVLREMGAPDASVDGPWCATQPSHTYCFDFDMVGTPEVGWSSNTISPGGAVALDTVTYNSPPASMQSTIQNGTVQGGTWAVLLENLSSSASSITCAFDFHSDLGPGSTYAATANLVDFFYGPGNYGASIGVSSTGPAFGWVVPTSTSYESGNVTLSGLNPDSTGWSHVVMTITVGSPWTVFVSFNGIVQTQQSLAGSVTMAGPQVAVSFGAVGLSGTTAMTTNYDNITIDVQ